MSREEYIRAVVKGLNCSRKQKKKIEADLAADITAALEQGEIWAEVRERLGDPAEMAEEFNDNLGPQRKQNSKWIIATLIILFAVAAVVAYRGYLKWNTPKGNEIGTSGYFYEDEIISQAKLIVDLLNKEDYETLRDDYSKQELAETLTAENMNAAKAATGSNLGEFVKYTSELAGEINQGGIYYGVVELVALYENRSVTYTISFDTEMKLAGVYMK